MHDPNLYQEELEAFKAHIGRLIDQERQHLGMERWSLAVRAGISERQLRRMVAGEHASLRAMIGVLNALGLELSVTHKRRTEKGPLTCEATTSAASRREANEADDTEV